jgi:hypothetical protein
MDRDLYVTPSWVTEELLRHVNIAPYVLEPACGDGAMMATLLDAGHEVWASDIHPLCGNAGTADFLSPGFSCSREIGAIVTNPPFNLATEFVERSIDLMQPGYGQVAMLLPTDWDHAQSRWHLFGGCPIFSRKVVLSKRIQWFPKSKGGKGMQPMGNHAWFVWDWRHHGSPAISYMKPADTQKAPRKRASKPVAPIEADADMMELVF